MARKTISWLIKFINAKLLEYGVGDRSMIRAIKILREQTGMGLVDAKHWVEERRSSLSSIDSMVRPQPMVDPDEFASRMASELHGRGAHQVAAMVEESNPKLHVLRELGRAITLAEKYGLRIWVMEDGAGTAMTAGNVKVEKA